MNERLTVYRIGFNGNDETEVNAVNEKEALELAKMVAKENGVEFNLDYIESCGRLTWICVYRDTIEEHDDDWNLSEVLVTEDFARQYFKECQTERYFDYWLEEYNADDTEDFYDYAMKHNAVLDIDHWK